MPDEPFARGVMLLLFDIASESIAEHDEWHTREHMPERLGIPGFVRGTRWIARDGPPRYCVMYEVADVAVLDSAAYRERLDHPTPWTRAMMPAYIGMRRALCDVEATCGTGIGSTALVARFAPAEGRGDELRRWLASDVLPALAQRRGVARCYVLRNVLAAKMTREQEIRGRDQTVHSALVVSGYDEDAVCALARDDLAAERFVARGAAAADFAANVYRQAFALTSAEA
jgi:hypothetical protein